VLEVQVVRHIASSRYVSGVSSCSFSWHCGFTILGPISRLPVITRSISLRPVVLRLVSSPLVDGGDVRCGSGVGGGSISAGPTSSKKERDQELVALALEACGPSSWEFDAPKAPISQCRYWCKPDSPCSPAVELQKFSGTARSTAPRKYQLAIGGRHTWTSGIHLSIVANC